MVSGDACYCVRLAHGSVRAASEDVAAANHRHSDPQGQKGHQPQRQTVEIQLTSPPASQPQQGRYAHKERGRILCFSSKERILELATHFPNSCACFSYVFPLLESVKTVLFTQLLVVSKKLSKLVK